MPKRKRAQGPIEPIIGLKPMLLNVKDAANYCGCSASYLNQIRAKDAKAHYGGLPIRGPVWVMVPFGIRYRPADLDAWVNKGDPFGIVESRRPK